MAAACQGGQAYALALRVIQGNPDLAKPTGVVGRCSDWVRRREHQNLGGNVQQTEGAGDAGNTVGRHENGRPFRDGRSNPHSLTIVGSPNTTTRGDSFGLFLPPLLTTPCAASHLLVIVGDHLSLDYYRKKKGDSDTIDR